MKAKQAKQTIELIKKLPDFWKQDLSSINENAKEIFGIDIESKSMAGIFLASLESKTRLHIEQLQTALNFYLDLKNEH